MYTPAVDERSSQDGAMQSEAPPFPRCVEDAPLVLTRLVLDAYARYCAQHAPGTTRAVNTPTGSPHTAAAEGAPGTAVAPGSSSGDATGTDVVADEMTVTSMEEMLAPLEVLYGKTFLAAVGIALHGTEAILRYVEHDEGADGASAAVTELRDARCVYRVGQYTLLSPFYCPCTAYAYQCVRRKELWCCKHMLALQLVLALEAAGVPPDNLHTRRLDRQSFHNTLMEAV